MEKKTTRRSGRYTGTRDIYIYRRPFVITCSTFDRYPPYTGHRPITRRSRQLTETLPPGTVVFPSEVSVTFVTRRVPPAYESAVFRVRMSKCRPYDKSRARESTRRVR